MIGIPHLSFVVIVNMAPNVFIVEIFDGEVLVVEENVISFCFFNGLPNCDSFDLI